MTICSATETTPEFPMLLDPPVSIHTGEGCIQRKVYTLEEAADLLDLLENRGIRNVVIERCGNSHFEIRWRIC